MNDDWLEGPTVYSDDPTTGHGPDGTRWLVARGGGPHCAARDQAGHYGCGRPPGHLGLHLPVAEQLLAEGIRLDLERWPATPAPGAEKP